MFAQFDFVHFDRRFGDIFWIIREIIGSGQKKVVIRFGWQRFVILGCDSNLNIKNENQVSMQSILGITVCYENTFDDILIDPYLKQYFTNTFNIINVTNVMKFTIDSNETKDYINKALVYYKEHMIPVRGSINKQFLTLLITNIINTHFKYTNDFNGHNIINSTQYELNLYSNIISNETYGFSG